MSDLRATVGTRVFNLSPVKEALDFASDLLAGIDVMNAAKNCQEMRPSPLADQIEEAIALIEEMEQHQLFAQDQANG